MEYGDCRTEKSSLAMSSCFSLSVPCIIKRKGKINTTQHNVKHNEADKMRIRLSNGQIIESNTTSSGTSSGSTPSKHQVKINSGRSSRRAMNGQAVLQRVGGYRNNTRAIYAPADAHLCRVVDDTNRTYTLAVGGSTTTTTRHQGGDLGGR